jgi:hypothetical protein
LSERGRIKDIGQHAIKDTCLRDSPTTLMSDTLTRRSLPSEGASAKLKTLSLKFFANLIGTLDLTRAHELDAPLSAIVGKLAQLAPAQLFSDWSPPRDDELKEIALSDPAASSTESSSTAAGNVLTETSGSVWTSSANVSETTLTLKVPADSPPLSELSIHWNVSSGKRLLPGTLRVETKSSKEAPYRVVAVVDGDALAETTRIKCGNATVAEIKLTMTGYAAVNKSSQHGIVRIRAWSSVSPGSHVTSKGGLQAMEGWMLALCASDDVTASIKDTAAAGMTALASSSASLVTMLKLFQYLHGNCSAVVPSDSKLCHAALELQSALRVAAWEQKQTQATAELARSGVAASSGPAYGEIPGVLLMLHPASLHL